MQALFVHGMGRSPLSGYPLLRRLEREGVRTHTFAYLAAVEAFPRIVARLAVKMEDVAQTGDYVLIGHSLGGVLIRAVLSSGHALPRPARRVFLLGSPVTPARLATVLGQGFFYRAFTGDCGQLLGSAARMASIGAPSAPTTAIVGTRGWPGSRVPFDGEPNDGVVSLAEVTAEWIDEQLQVPVMHSFLPASPSVADLIADRVRA